MSQQSSTQLESTWGKFLTKQAAKTTKNELTKAGIDSKKITIETDEANNPVKIEDTEAIANIKAGAIAGGVLGFLVGLSISLILTNFSTLGLAALDNFQAIHYFSPVMGAIVGAAGMSLILGISGASVLKDNTSVSKQIENSTESKEYLVVVKGTAEEVALTREIIAQQGGVVEDADRR